MAIAEKQFQSELPALLQQFMGTKTSGTQTATGNTGPLQQVFGQASTAMDPAMYQQLIQGIFGTAAQKVPELTAALANATGSRSSNNSPLALALNEQNNLAGAQAAKDIMAYNQSNLQTATQAAGKIADTTRSTTSTQKQGSGGNPAALMLGGTLLNQFDKRGGMDWLGKKAGSVVDAGADYLSNMFSPQMDFAFPQMDTGGGLGASFDQYLAPQFSNFNDSAGMDFGGVGDFAGDFLGGVSDFAGDAFSGAGDFLGGIADDIGGWFGFADGGMIHPRGMPMAGGWNSQFLSPMVHPGLHMNPRLPMRREGYANGGTTGGGMIPARARAPMQVADRAAMGGDPNQMMQMILQQAMMPQPVQAPPPNIINFLRYLLPTSDFNITQYGDGGSVGNKQRYPAGGGYAEGGIIRNRNNMGGPIQRQGQGVINFSGAQNSGAGNVGTTSDALTQMLLNASNMSGRQTADREADVNRGKGPGQISDEQAASISSFNAADNYATRDKTLAAMLGMVGGLVAPGLLGADVAQALGMTGVTTSVPAGLVKMIKTNLEGVNAAERSAAINASAPEGSAGVAGVDGIGGMSVGAAGVDSLGLSPNMTNVAAPDLMSYFGESDVGGGGSFGGAGGYGGDDSADSAYGGANTGPGADTGGAQGNMSDQGGSGGGRGGGGGFGGGTGGMGDANGGLLRGPGTGTSDSMPAKSRVPGEAPTSFSNGEFIIPRDSVEFYGEEFFKNLLLKSHSPVRR